MTGIVVVTWNSAEVIGACIDGCLPIPDTRIVVVDNASADGTSDVVRRRPGVHLIANASNRGFAGGCNQGIAACHECESVLLLNPDAVPVRGIDVLASEVQQPGVGAAGGALIDGRDLPQAGFNVRSLPQPLTLAFEVLGLNRLFPDNKWNRRYRSATVHAPAEVEQPAGAFLMVNRRVWQQLGGMDERFHPAWFEDVDYCARLLAAGYRIRFIPDAQARHIGGHSAGKLPWEDRQVFWYDNLLRYAAKHFTVEGRRTVAVATMVASVLRGTAGLLQGKPGAPRVYSKVFVRALRHWRDECDISDLADK